MSEVTLFSDTCDMLTGGMGEDSVDECAPVAEQEQLSRSLCPGMGYYLQVDNCCIPDLIRSFLAAVSLAPLSKCWERCDVTVMS